MIKNIVTFSLMIFIILIMSILGAAVFLQPAKTSTQGLAGGSNTNGTVVTSSEVARHNSTNDCWLIVSDKIYNVTDYINIHPAGPETITPYCGKDATTAFNTKNGKGSHSQRATDNLNAYYVGNFSR